MVLLKSVGGCMLYCKAPAQGSKTPGEAVRHQGMHVMCLLLAAGKPPHQHTAGIKHLCGRKQQADACCAAKRPSTRQ